MASNSKKSREGEDINKCSVQPHKCDNIHCSVSAPPTSTVNLLSTSKAAAVDRAINNHKDILGDEIFYIPCSKRTYKTLAEISQNDFIVNNLYTLDSSTTLTTLTVDVIKRKFTKLFTDINSDGSSTD